MCVFSKEHESLRAILGERLTVWEFEHGGRWFAREVPGKEKRCPVCIPNGAQLCFQRIPQHVQKELGIQEGEEVTFFETSFDTEKHFEVKGHKYTKHGAEVADLFMRANGDTLSINDLPLSMKVQVLSLVSQENPAETVLVEAERIGTESVDADYGAKGPKRRMVLQKTI